MQNSSSAVKGENGDDENGDDVGDKLAKLYEQLHILGSDATEA